MVYKNLEWVTHMTFIFLYCCNSYLAYYILFIVSLNVSTTESGGY